MPPCGSDDRDGVIGLEPLDDDHRQLERPLDLLRDGCEEFTRRCLLRDEHRDAPQRCLLLGQLAWVVHRPP